MVRGMMKGRFPKREGEATVELACICPRFSDTGGFRIADLGCPVHGVDGTDPGDGYWDEGDDEQRAERMFAAMDRYAAMTTEEIIADVAQPTEGDE